ncbi:uncharacterized protein LOC123662765 [Melitaea cinxia]|uniref:uncharacterized protein LOC123662765 n=1 Tax=Melitaea cinxia TaxID=113334 RepID=UPI001E271BFB|nr:uncharacterized protein LOC123662765 [Melitaea cinxia]
MINEEGSIQDKLQRFLMMYRKTPNNTTGLSPGEMMFKRIYRTRIDLVKRPQELRNNSNEEIIVTKEFQRGEKVQIRMYDSNKWKFGNIVNRKGKLHYEVEVDGRIHQRHVDQIIKTSCLDNNFRIPDTYLIKPRESVANLYTPKLPEKDLLPGKNILPGKDVLPGKDLLPEKDLTTTHANATRRESIPYTETSEVDKPETPQATPDIPPTTQAEIEPRRSTRIRRPPNRLNF